MSRTALIIGSSSEIGSYLGSRLISDGWLVDGWKRGDLLPSHKWDLCVIAIGTVAPVGWWHSVSVDKWVECIESNLILPFEMLQAVWQDRKRNSAVCFLAGSNPQKIMDGYSAYNIGKMALLKMVEQIDHESPDSKLFALGPGYIETKIHDATKAADWPNAVIDSGRKGGEMSSVYEALMWCVQQPKEVVGGRNICVSDIGKPNLAHRLNQNPDLFKLRRVE